MGIANIFTGKVKAGLATALVAAGLAGCASRSDRVLENGQRIQTHEMSLTVIFPNGFATLYQGTADSAPDKDYLLAVEKRKAIANARSDQERNALIREAFASTGAEAMPLQNKLRWDIAAIEARKYNPQPVQLDMAAQKEIHSFDPSLRYQQGSMIVMGPQGVVSDVAVAYVEQQIRAQLCKIPMRINGHDVVATNLQVCLPSKEAIDKSAPQMISDSEYGFMWPLDDSKPHNMLYVNMYSMAPTGNAKFMSDLLEHAEKVVSQPVPQASVSQGPVKGKNTARKPAKDAPVRAKLNRQAAIVDANELNEIDRMMSAPVTKSAAAAPVVANPS